MIQGELFRGEVFASFFQVDKQRKGGHVRAVKLAKMTFQTISVCSLRDGYKERTQPGPPRCTTPGGAIHTVFFVAVKGIIHLEHSVWVLPGAV